jgi:hypothetical protein
MVEARPRELHAVETREIFNSSSILPKFGITFLSIADRQRRMRWAGDLARMVEKRNAYRVLVGKLAGKRPLGRPRLEWMDLGEIGWDWIDVVQDRYQWRALVNTVMNLRVP